MNQAEKKKKKKRKKKKLGSYKERAIMSLQF